MRAENQVILAAFLVIAGVGIGTLINSDVGRIDISDFVTAGSTLIAAFLGSWSAFELQNRKAARDAESANVGALNRAIFSTIMQINKLKNIESQLVGPVRDNTLAFISMQAIHELEKDEVPIDINSVSFILETKSRNLLAQLSIAQASFRSAIDSVNVRSRVHINEFQPLLEKAGVKAEDVFAIDDPESFLGSRLYITLQRATNDLVQTVDSALAKLESVSAALSEFGRTQFGPGRIITINAPSDAAQT